MKEETKEEAPPIGERVKPASTHTVRPAHLERLAMCKYMVDVADQQLRQPDPRAAIALLTYHDSVELFLVTAADYLGIAADRGATFLVYWKLMRSVGRKMPFFGAMKRLNDSRVALKHHGHIPRRADLAEFRVVVSEFYQEAVAEVFGLNWDDVSMSDYVAIPSVREALKSAERSLADNQIDEGLSACAGALDDLTTAAVKAAMHGNDYRSPFDLGEDMHFKTSSGMGLSRVGPTTKLAEFVDATAESIQAIRQALKIVLLGIDYKSYIRFTRLSPIINKYYGGKRTFHQRHHETPPSAADLQFCIEFVLGAAMRLQSDIAAVDDSPSVPTDGS